MDGGIGQYKNGLRPESSHLGDAGQAAHGTVIPRVKAFAVKTLRPGPDGHGGRSALISTTSQSKV
jgi:hypothetical protein